MHDFKKHLEKRLKRINEQRDGKKDAAKKKFKSMKAKWDENEKLVTCIVCPFTMLVNWLQLPRKRELRRFQTVSRISRRKKKVAGRRSKKSNGLFKPCRQTWQSPSKSKIFQR